jgi:Ca2+-binding EF-hand superfamily protein
MDNTVCYRFQINAFQLDITQETVGALGRLVLQTRLCQLSLHRLYDVMSLHCTDGLMSKEQYDAAVRDLVPSDSLSVGEKKEFALVLSTLFFAFDRTETNVVDVAELCCGFSILCSGSKSSKLSYSFEWMDEDEDNQLSRRGLWRYFRSFLCALLTLSGATLDIPMDEATRICDQCAVWTASKLFAALDEQSPGRPRSSVSFEDIADWYTAGGYQVATWLELLDLSKWLTTGSGAPIAAPYYGDEDDDATESTSSSESSESSGADSEAESEDDSSAGNGPSAEAGQGQGQPDEIFRVQLIGGKDLMLSSQDAQFIKEISVASGLCCLWPADIVRVLQTFSFGGYVSREGFEEFTQHLDLHPDLGPSEQQELIFGLLLVYDALDFDKSSLVSFESLASGLTLFAKGSKSSKLGVAFSLFDRSISNNAIEWGTGVLDESELALFIQSYLVMLLACSSSLPSVGKVHALSKGEQLLAFVSATAHSVARQVVRESESSGSKAGRRSVDFQTFGDWYNQGGFRSVPWLELIDLSKWAHLPSPGKKAAWAAEEASEEDYDRYGRGESDSEESEGVAAVSAGVRALEEQNEDDADTGTSNAAPSFMVVLHKDAGDSTVSIASNVARDFIRFVSYSGLSSCSADTLWAAMSQAAVDGLISRSAFHSVMKRFIAALTTVSSDRAFAHIEEQAVGYLDPLFSAFDRTNSELADVVELCCGASLLCSG